MYQVSNKSSKLLHHHFSPRFRLIRLVTNFFIFSRDGTGLIFPILTSSLIAGTVRATVDKYRRGDIILYNARATAK